MRPPILTLTLNPAIDLHLRLADGRRREVSRAIGTARAAGGKGVNVARVLAALGVPATAAVALGGPDAVVYRALLAEAAAGRGGFQSAFLPAGGPTRTNVTIAVGASSARAARRMKINQSGPAWNAADWKTALARIDRLARGRQWIVLAGAPPPGVPASAYRRLIDLAHAAGARCAIDADGLALRAALAAKPDLLRINLEECAALLRIAPAKLRARRDRIAAVRRLLARGIGLVVISAGRGETLLASPDGVWVGASPRIAARGPLGAGDAMLAGLLASLIANHSPERALQLGLACGAATAALDETAFPTRPQIAKQRPRVKIARVA
jgi:1-phosphofructokinase family hexose kinase